VAATSAGYHEHRGVPLDERLDDYSRSGIMERRRFYYDFERKLQLLNMDSLSEQDRADLAILHDQINLSLLDLNRIQSFRHNPTLYVELAGDAIFNPFVLEYAPQAKRFQQIIQRLRRMPVLFEQARDNLADAPQVWNRVAREENEGNIELIDRTLRAAAPPELKAEYENAAKPALDALRKFNTYLEKDLSRHTASWRLGQEKYSQKFKYTLETDKPVSEVLAQAEAALQQTRREMAELAAPQDVPTALARIAGHHPVPENYLDEARRDLQQATEFVRSAKLVPLPASSNLQVIPTPEFMRGIYGVGGFNPSPPLEPQLRAFYWVTPIPTDWPRERIESKLREYNEYGLQELTIHEAMPGHSVQFEYANQVAPKGRRLLRTLYGNGPYVEGWAVYAQQIMSDAGYLNNSRDLRLTYLKWILRSIANAIIDIRLQTMDMSEEEAKDLMIRQTYQEEQEATAKIQRAQLSSCQLPTYFVGWRGWLDTRKNYQQKQGAAFQLSEFHERALKLGAVPMASLPKLLQ
jgi:uncharacterized protein (DUF885 family)